MNEPRIQDATSLRAILIVRLGALGDLVHALPAVAALRRTFPEARIDWLAKRAHRALLDLVPVIDCRIYLGRKPGARPFQNPEPAAGAGGERTAVAVDGGFLAAARALRRARYDAAIDLQGLGKSAVLARLSGARTVIGFPRPYLRESWARAFYTDVCDPRGTVHVIEKNLSAVALLGAPAGERVFPLQVPASGILEKIRALLPPDAGGRYALLNPGGGWPNKRWPPDRFAAVASVLRSRHGLPSVVLCGPGERGLARAVVEEAAGAAVAAPPTTIAELLTLAASSRLVVSGDTGPLHLAAAVGAPVVGIYGPTSPARNGPWDPRDICLSRSEVCVCHHKRRCRRRVGPCILEIGPDEVLAAIDRRLARQGACRR
jgi:lipopolysaccharide heptosyltransferase I